MLSRWSAMQSCNWDERIVSVQFKEEMNIWSRATFATKTHNNQPPTLRLGEEDTSYKQIVILCNNTASFWLETWAWMCIRKSTQRIWVEKPTLRLERQYTIEGGISLIPIMQPCLDSSCNEIFAWKRVDWINIDRARAVLWWGRRRGEIESLTMVEPRHFTSQAQKSNASGDHEIHNDNGSESFLNPHHWIRNEILHLMVRVKEIVQV